MSVLTYGLERTCHVCDAVNTFVYKLYLKMAWQNEINRNLRVFNEIKNIDAEAGYHLQRLNDNTNDKYSGLMRNNRPFKWAWEDDGE